MKIKICIVGTHQSGSTRLFNLVRLIYEKINKSVFSRFNIKDVNNLQIEEDVILCKIHDTTSNYLNDFDIKLLPVRNILDSAISLNARRGISLIDGCIRDINLFNKFKSDVDFIFRYEDYSIYYIKRLCSILNVNLNNFEIIEIMKELEDMLNNKNIVKKDNPKNPQYRKTLLSQDHNTSNGKSNKFVQLPTSELKNLLKNDLISNFLKENKYI